MVNLSDMRREELKARLNGILSVFVSLVQLLLVLSILVISQHSFLFILFLAIFLIFDCIYIHIRKLIRYYGRSLVHQNKLLQEWLLQR